MYKSVKDEKSVIYPNIKLIFLYFIKWSIIIFLITKGFIKVTGNKIYMINHILRSLELSLDLSSDITIFAFISIFVLIFTILQYEVVMLDSEELIFKKILCYESFYIGDGILIPKEVEAKYLFIQCRYYLYFFNKDNAPKNLENPEEYEDSPCLGLLFWGKSQIEKLESIAERIGNKNMSKIMAYNGNIPKIDCVALPKKYIFKSEILRMIVFGVLASAMISSIILINSREYINEELSFDQIYFFITSYIRIISMFIIIGLVRLIYRKKRIPEVICGDKNCLKINDMYFHVRDILSVEVTRINAKGFYFLVKQRYLIIKTADKTYKYWLGTKTTIGKAMYRRICRILEEVFVDDKSKLIYGDIWGELLWLDVIKKNVEKLE